MTEETNVNAANKTQQTGAVSPEVRTQRTIRRTYLVSAAFLFFALANDFLSFGEFGAWQILGDASGILIAIIFLALSYFQYQRGETEKAAYLIPFAIMFAYAPGDLFLDGVTIYNLLSGLLLLGIASYIFKPRNYAHWIRLALVFTFIVLLLGNTAFFAKFNIANSPSWETSLPITTIAFAALLFWQIMTSFQVRTIQARLLIILIALGLGPVLIASAISTLVNLQRDTTLAENSLESVAEFRSVQITDWAQDLQDDIRTLESNPEFMLHAEYLTQFTPTAAFRQQIFEVVTSAMESLTASIPDFRSLSFVSPEGEILISTDNQLPGKSIGGEPDFMFGSSRNYFSTPSVDTLTDQTVTKMYYPLVNEQSVLIGVILADISLEAIGDFTTEAASQLGETGEAYLINSQDQLLTPLRNLEDIQTGSYVPSSETFGISGTDSHSFETQTLNYDNFTGQRVIGTYTWIPEIKSALVVEQNESEAYQSLRLNLVINAVIVIIAVAVTTTIAVSTAQSFSTPIKNLSDAARRVWQGEITKIDPIERIDEIGELSTTLSEMTARLTDTTVNLEETVAERTAALEKRAKYLETVSTISRAVTNIYDLNALLSTITQLISENFGFYHVGIFLNDERDEYAVLRAANSEGGWKMLAREHKLKVGEQGIVGFVTGKGEARIQQQVVGEDSVYFNNPDLPQTRSEMALPLKTGNVVFGALDVQSTEEQAFTEEDVIVLQGMADSLAVAIQNTRLIQQLQENLEAERRLFGEVTRDSWRVMLARSGRSYTVRSDPGGTEFLATPSTEFGKQAMIEKRTIIGELDEDGGGYPLAIPVSVRGGVAIGALETQKPASAGPWSQEEISILENVSSELGLALDNARLFEETQRKAQRDRIAAELSTKIWSSSDMENILQTAIRELGSALQVSQGTIRLSLPDEDKLEKSADGANQS